MIKQPVVRSSQAVRKILSLLALFLCVVVVPGAFAANGPGTCATNPESRQLDFWVGDWTISSPGASSNSTSTVSLSLDSCVITESWDGGKGHRGENIFAYSSGDKGWRGLFVDNEGRAHAFVDGKISSGHRRVSGAEPRPERRRGPQSNPRGTPGTGQGGTNLGQIHGQGRYMVARFSPGVFAKEILMAASCEGHQTATRADQPTHFRPKARASNSSEAGRCSAKYDQS